MGEVIYELVDDDALPLEMDDMPAAERIAAVLLSALVRLWCLPVLFLLWLVLGSVVLVIRVTCPARGASRIAVARNRRAPGSLAMASRLD